MKKSQLLKEKEFAELNGDNEKAIELGREIDRLEDEAKKRDKIRTQNIAAISFINERNRMRNIKEAERAIAEAAKEAQNNKDDPFTRRKCTPTMIHVFNKNKQQTSNDNSNLFNTTDSIQTESDPVIVESKDVLDSKNAAPKVNNSTSRSTNKQSIESSEDANDMFSVHNFDIKIDFESLNFNMSNSNPSTMSSQASFSNGFLSGLSNGNSNGFPNSRSNMNNSSTNRRSLNLDEYKRKKGLI